MKKKESSSQLKDWGEMKLCILETQEMERKRIARELHDTTVQNLTNLIHLAEICTESVDEDPIYAKLELQTMISTMRLTISDMRDMIYDLRPMSIDDLGLVITIEHYVAQMMANQKKVEFIFSTQSEIPDLNATVVMTLFRVLQEACNNILKHADAKHIYIELVREEEEVELSIRDDGKGFDDSTIVEHKFANKAKHFGLSIMKERVELLSGQVAIQSEKNVGTKICVRIPLDAPLMKENTERRGITR